MPSKNVIRQYTENAYYHVYNRGVEKRTIFLDEQDYRMFLYYLFVYLVSLDTVLHHYPKLRWNLKQHNLYGKVELLAYCLMPNHFHFLVKQVEADTITKLMRQVTNAYTFYFNKKYDRVGALLQGIFKAALVSSEPYLLHLSRYIHQNCSDLDLAAMGCTLNTYPWSSYPCYLGQKRSLFVNPSFILSYFSVKHQQFSYQEFVESNATALDLPNSLRFDEDTQGGTLSYKLDDGMALRYFSKILK